MATHAPVLWEASEVRSPTLDHPVKVVAARNVPTTAGGHRFQTLNLYLPFDAAAGALVGKAVDRLPARSGRGVRYQAHVHGGAWRDPTLDATSVEPAAAHAFADPERPVAAIASLNYTLTQFPTHPAVPYDAEEDGHSDPSREAVFPAHLRDVLNGLNLLRTLGFDDGSYVLTGHSAGSCLAMQAALAEPGFYGLPDVAAPPVPAAVVGTNGLYDLPGLVLGADAAHEGGTGEYKMMLRNAFGADDRLWARYSPARLDPAAVARRVRAGLAPALAVVDQSGRDQLVSMNQRDRLIDNLRQVQGLEVVTGRHCRGRHSAVWQQGDALWLNVRDAIGALAGRLP